MPNLVRPPRVSIVIPLQRDEARFEATLLSVLENQPSDCQIIAVHNGTYTDPFDLSDELTFVTARSSNLVDLIRDAFDSTNAPLVHVLGTGLKATDGWLDESLERSINDDVAAVNPSLIDDDGSPLGKSGWFDSDGQLCVSRQWTKQAPSGRAIEGFHLSAFTIRRRILGEMLEAVAPAMNDPVAVGYAFGCLLCYAGWKVEADANGSIIGSEAIELVDASDVARGQCLGAIRRRILPDLPRPTFAAMLMSAIFGTSSLAEMVGLMGYRKTLTAMRRAIDPESVSSRDELVRILELEQNVGVTRRAA